MNITYKITKANFIYQKIASMVMEICWADIYYMDISGKLY